MSVRPTAAWRSPGGDAQARAVPGRRGKRGRSAKCDDRLGPIGARGDAVSRAADRRGGSDQIKSKTCRICSEEAVVRTQKSCDARAWSGRCKFPRAAGTTVATGLPPTPCGALFSPFFRSGPGGFGAAERSELADSSVCRGSVCGGESQPQPSTPASEASAASGYLAAASQEMAKSDSRQAARCMA